jgi:UDP-N-acetylmuramoyl-tripeptide--D-alanyl-D-alanine ligase
LVALAERFAGRKILAGGKGPIRATSVAALGEGLRVEMDVEGVGMTVVLPVRGTHNVQNALLATAAARALGVDRESIAAGLGAFRPPPMRLEVVVVRDGALILNDAYNANPASMKAALTTLAAEPGRRKIAVLGEMLELGTEEAHYHREAGASAARLHVDLLIAVGPWADEVVAGAVEAGLASDQAVACVSTEKAAERLAATIGEGDVVLLKGSRGAKMEAIVEGLRERG